MAHAVHVGHHIGVNYNINNKANRELVCRTNTMLSRFKFCSSKIKSRLLRTECASLYGCPLWDLRNNYIKYFHMTWRNLPYRCHDTFTYIVYDDLPSDIQLILRFINFYLGVLTSKHPTVFLCSHVCPSSNTAVAKHKRTCKLLQYLDDNGDSSILYEQKYIR